MKHTVCIIGFGLLALQEKPVAQNYSEGDTLSVVASSGLRLRTEPNVRAGTLRVLEAGEPVVIENTFGFDTDYLDRSGWLDGSWVYVSHSGISGFVFDAYLTSLDLPTHETELYFEGTSWSEPLLAYLTRHYPVEREEQGSAHREDIDQCITYHTGGITLTRTTGHGWNKTDLLLRGYRFSEVVNLFRSMLVGDALREEFDRNLVFHKNRQNEVYRVVLKQYGYDLTIECRQDSLMHVSLTELHGSNGT